MMGSSPYYYLVQKRKKNVKSIKKKIDAEFTP